MKIAVIPDVQAKPGNNFAFLNRIGRYIADKGVDRVVCIGDFADMPSLSSYDKGKKSFENRRYIKDLEAAHYAMEQLMDGLSTNGPLPGLELTYGNHEERILRVGELNPELDGVVTLADLNYESFGWRCHPFLEVINIGGVAFSHYFVSGAMGRPVGTAARLLSTKHMSCVAGHQQGRQIATGFKADGSPVSCIIAGSCYEHNEDYMGPQANKHWRGIVMLHEVKNGSFDEMFVSLNFLKQRYK
jgi:hypothetical protein